MSLFNRSSSRERRTLGTFLFVRLLPITTDLFATLIMGLGTSFSAWSGYQSEQWNVTYSKNLLVATAAARDATRLALEANQKTLLDAAMFLQYFEAIEQHQTHRADFIETRFRPEFAEAFQRWEGTNPIENSKAPATPFDLPGYKVKERVDAEAKSGLAADNIKRGYAALATARSYSFLAVLFTIVLFLGGISAKLSNLNQRRFIVSLSAFFLALAFLRMMRLPLAP